MGGKNTSYKINSFLPLTKFFCAKNCCFCCLIFACFYFLLISFYFFCVFCVAKSFLQKKEFILIASITMLLKCTLSTSLWRNYAWPYFYLWESLLIHYHLRKSFLIYDYLWESLPFCENFFELFLSVRTSSYLWLSVRISSYS